MTTEAEMQVIRDINKRVAVEIMGWTNVDRYWFEGEYILAAHWVDAEGNEYIYSDYFFAESPTAALFMLDHLRKTIPMLGVTIERRSMAEKWSVKIFAPDENRYAWSGAECVAETLPMAASLAALAFIEKWQAAHAQ